MGEPALGSLSKLAIDFETAFATVKGTPVLRYLPHVSGGINPSQELLDNPTLGSDLNPKIPAFGKKASSGNLVIVPNLKCLPFITKWVTGHLATTGAADPYTHTSLLGATAPASCVMETFLELGATDKYLKALGCRVGKLSIPFAVDGFPQFQMDIQGKDASVEAASLDASPDDWSTDTPLDNAQLAAADVEIGGSDVVYIQSGQIDITANLYGDDYRVGGGGSRASLCVGRYTIGGNLKLAVDSADVLTLLTAGDTSTTLRLLWTLDTNRTFEITLPKIYFPKNLPVVNDAGPMTVDAPFQAAYDAVTTSAVKFVTVNDQAGTAYA